MKKVKMFLIAVTLLLQGPVFSEEFIEEKEGLRYDYYGNTGAILCRASGEVVLGAGSSPGTVWYWFSIPNGSIQKIVVEVTGWDEQASFTSTYVALYSPSGMKKLGTLQFFPKSSPGVSRFEIATSGEELKKYLTVNGKLNVMISAASGDFYAVKKIRIIYTYTQPTTPPQPSPIIQYPLLIKIEAEPKNVKSGEASKIVVKVTSNGKPISGVGLTSSIEGNPSGTLSPSFGFTDNQGEFITFYTAPKIEKETINRITIFAAKPGYLNASSSIDLTISPIVLQAPILWPIFKDPIANVLVIKWMPVLGNIGYEVQLSKDLSFQNAVGFSTLNTEFRYPAMPPGIFVRVRALYPQGPGPWSHIMGYTVPVGKKPICVSCLRYWLINDIDIRASSDDQHRFNMPFAVPFGYDPLVLDTTMGIENYERRESIYREILQTLVITIISESLDLENIVVTEEEAEKFLSIPDKTLKFLKLALAGKVPQELLKNRLRKQDIDKLASFLNAGSNYTSLGAHILDILDKILILPKAWNAYSTSEKRMEFFKVYKSLIQEKIVPVLKNNLTTTDSALMKALDSFYDDTYLDEIIRNWRLFIDVSKWLMDNKAKVLVSIKSLQASFLTSLITSVIIDDFIESLANYQTMTLVVSLSNDLSKNTSDESYLFQSFLAEQYYELVLTENRKWITYSSRLLADIFNNAGQQEYVNYIQERQEKIKSIESDLLARVNIFGTNEDSNGDSNQTIRMQRVYFDKVNRKLKTSVKGKIHIVSGNGKNLTFNGEEGITIDEIREKIGGGHLVIFGPGSFKQIIDVPYKK